MGGVQSGEDDSDEEEAEVHFHLRGRKPPPPPVQQTPEEEAVEEDKANGQESSSTAGTEAAIPQTETTERNPSSSSATPQEPGTDGLRQRKRNEKNTKKDAAAEKTQQPEKNEAADASTAGDPHGLLRFFSAPTGPQSGLIVKLLLLGGVVFAIALYTVPLEESFKQMRDGRYVTTPTPKKGIDKFEFEFTDTDGEMIKVKREKHSKSGKFCVNEYVNGSLEEYNMQYFIIDTVKRTYRDSQWTGHFRPDQNLEEMTSLRDKIFDFMEVTFKDADGDIISVKKERSTKKTCGHSVNIYVNGNLEDVDIKKFNIDVERRTYSDRLGEGRFSEGEDLPKLLALRNQMLGMNTSTAKEPEQQQGGWSTWLEDLMPLDRSFQGHIAWSRYVNHGFFAFATVALSVPPTRSDRKKKDSGESAATNVHKLYWHRYFGLFGCWIPVPYLPLPGNKENTYGVGFCVTGHCACCPDYFSKAAKTGRSCWKFTGGKTAALKFLLGPMVIIHALIYFKVVAIGRLIWHLFILPHNLRNGRLWVLFFAPFPHVTSSAEPSHSAVITSLAFLASAIISFSSAIEATEISFVVFCILFWGGCWCSSFAKSVLWNRLLRGDRYAYENHPDYGATGGIAAVLTFMIRAYPEEPFEFNLYFFTVPFTLCAWQSLVAHAIISAVLVIRPVLLQRAAFNPRESVFLLSDVKKDVWVPGIILDMSPDGTVKVQEEKGVTTVGQEEVARKLRKVSNEAVRDAVGPVLSYISAIIFGAVVYTAWRPHLAVSS